MRGFWNTSEPNDLQVAVAKLAAYLHYQQSGYGFWDTVKLDNGAILSVHWRYRPPQLLIDSRERDLAYPV